MTAAVVGCGHGEDTGPRSTVAMGVVQRCLANHCIAMHAVVLGHRPCGCCHGNLLQPCLDDLVTGCNIKNTVWVTSTWPAPANTLSVNEMTRVKNNEKNHTGRFTKMTAVINTPSVLSFNFPAYSKSVTATAMS